MYVPCLISCPEGKIRLSGEPVRCSRVHGGHARFAQYFRVESKPFGVCMNIRYVPLCDHKYFSQSINVNTVSYHLADSNIFFFFYILRRTNDFLLNSRPKMPKSIYLQRLLADVLAAVCKTFRETASQVFFPTR